MGFVVIDRRGIRLAESSDASRREVRELIVCAICAVIFEVNCALRSAVPSPVGLLVAVRVPIETSFDGVLAPNLRQVVSDAGRVGHFSEVAPLPAAAESRSGIAGDAAVPTHGV